MKIAKQTPTVLVVRAGAKIILLSLALIILIAGVLAIYFVRIEPLTLNEIDAPDLIKASQEKDPSDSQLRTPSTGYAGLNIAHYVGIVLLSKSRPIIPLGVAGIVIGLLILAGPHYSRSIILDKAGQRVTLKQPRWLFRSKKETYSFQDISEVRVERDRETLGRSNRNYRVSLVMSHHEGIPLGRDYVHYKTVFPLTESYRYSYQNARAIVERIQKFLSS
jgi:hypothetical protein